MKAMVYHGPGRRSWEEVPDPTIEQPTDAIVHVDAVTICGTDLHILKGDVPEVSPGRILGHEAGVSGDRVYLANDEGALPSDALAMRCRGRISSLRSWR